MPDPHKSCEANLVRAFEEVYETSEWVAAQAMDPCGTLPALTVYRPKIVMDGIYTLPIQSYATDSLLVKHDGIGRPIEPDWSEFDSREPGLRQMIDDLRPNADDPSAERNL